MKRNYIVGAILALPVILLFLWVINIQEKVAKAPSVMVSVTGYDPRDLLSGHYILLLPQWEKTDCSQFKENICPEADFDYHYRFYMQEDYAQKLDRVIRKTENLDMKLEFAFPEKAYPIVKELYIENLPWQVWVDKNAYTEEVLEE